MPSSANQTHSINWIYGQTSTSGAFCGVFESVALSRSLSLQNPQAVSQHMMLTVTTIPEPQIVIYSFSPWLRLSEVVDDNDAKWKDEVSNWQQIRHPSENVHTATGIPVLPVKMGHEIKSMTARRNLQIVTKFRKIEISEEELFNGTSFSSDGMSVQLKKPIDKHKWGMQYAMKVKFDKSVKEVPDPALVADGSMCAMIDETGRVMRQLWASNQSSDSEANLLFSFCPMPDEPDSHPTHMTLFLPLVGSDFVPEFHFTHIPFEQP